MKINWRVANWIFCFGVAFIFLLLFAVSISPLTPNEGDDSCVYKQLGLVMLKGKTPYVDVFDHKGPIMYMIQAVGMWIGGRWGLFLLNVLNLTGVLYLWNAIARHYMSNKKSYLPVLFTFLLYFGTMEEGNVTEDWCLLPLSYSVYLASRLFAYNKIPSFCEALFLGMSASIIILIRANNVALLLCAFALISVIVISIKKYKEFYRICIGALLGCLSVFIAVLLFFYYKYGLNGVEMMIYGTFIFNLIYIKLPETSHFEFFFSNNFKFNFYFVIAILSSGYSFINNKSKESKVLPLFFAISFFFCFFTMGRHSFIHYLITVIPLYVMCISFAFRNSVKEHVLFVFLAVFFSISNIAVLRSKTWGGLNDQRLPFYYKGDLLIASLDKGQKDSIWNYNALFPGLELLQRHGLIQYNRCVLPFQYERSDVLRESEEGRIEKVKPPIVLIRPDFPYYSEIDSLFIKENYVLRDSLSKEVLVYELKKDTVGM